MNYLVWALFSDFIIKSQLPFFPFSDLMHKTKINRYITVSLSWCICIWNYKMYISVTVYSRNLQYRCRIVWHQTLHNRDCRHVFLDGNKSVWISLVCPCDVTTGVIHLWCFLLMYRMAQPRGVYNHLWRFP
jgi:hypothetical protein